MVSKHRFCWIFCFFVFLVARETFGLIDCTDAILENSFVGTCNNKWKNLNPILKRKIIALTYILVKINTLKRYFSNTS